MKKYFTVRGVSVLSCLFLLSSCAEDELNICFTGDLLLDRGVRQQIEKKGVDALFENVAPLFSTYDAVVVNLECPVTERNTPINKRYIFRAEPQYLPALKRAGITHAALANNHTNDQNRAGIEDTYNYLKANNIIPLGAGKNETEACNPIFINKGKIKVALFNSVLIPLENWVYLSDTYGVCQSSPDELCEKIRNLRSVEKDCYVVVVLHWGVEYAATPLPEQRYTARKLIDAGADAVIGHHPHVVQPIEIYRGKYIFYSLGNFIFDSKRENANVGILASLSFSKTGIKGKHYDYKIKRCVPIVIKKSQEQLQCLLP